MTDTTPIVLIERSLGEVQLALAGGRNPKWGPLAQAIVELRRYVEDAATDACEAGRPGIPRPAQLLSDCQMAVKASKGEKR